MVDTYDKVKELESRREKIKLGGGVKAVEKQHKEGKLTARERLDRLFDPGTFMELDIFAKCLGREFGMAGRDVPADGIIIGFGKVDGRPVAAFSADYTCIAGTFGEMHGRKMNKIIEFGMDKGMPVVGLNDCAGARLQENMGPLSQYGRLFYLNSIASGVVPQIAVLMGPVAGGQAYSPGLNDFLFMVKGMASTFIAGPPLVEAMVGEKATAEELGGVEVHSKVSGVCHVVAEDENDCIDKLKKLLSYLPSSNREKPPWMDTGDNPSRVSERLYQVVPVDRWVPYDMHEVICEIVDNGEIFEIHKDFHPEMLCCFARLGGHSVGLVANNPRFLAGCITTQAAEKAARFKRFCDCFNIPIINFIDTPAYLVGTVQERLGIIYRGAKLLYATAEATVPQISVYVGKAFAGGYLTMGSKDFDVDFVFAWPTAEIALVGPEGTINVLFRKEIAEAADPEAERKKREQEFRETYMSVYYPAGLQHIDDIIDPKETRPVLIRSLEALKNKKKELPWKKHGNIPL